jgi:hypothetical protein
MACSGTAFFFLDMINKSISNITLYCKLLHMNAAAADGNDDEEEEEEKEALFFEARLRDAGALENLGENTRQCAACLADCIYSNFPCSVNNCSHLFLHV